MDRANQDYFNIISKYAPVAMAILDQDFNYLSVTQKWLQLFDLDNSIIGKKHIDIFPKTHTECLIKSKEVLKGKEVNFFQERYEKKNGARLYLNWELRGWYDTKSGKQGIVIVCEDASKRKNIEEALLESEQRFKVIFDQTAIGLVLVSLSGNIISANAKACEVFGYPKKELLKKNISGNHLQRRFRKRFRTLKSINEGRDSNLLYGKKIYPSG